MLPAPARSRPSVSPDGVVPLRLVALAATLLLALAGLSGPAVAHEGHAPDAREDEDGGWDLFPSGDSIYPNYMADPRQVRFGLSTHHFPEVGIPAAGEQRVLVELGGTFDLAAFHPRGSEGKGWRISIVSGFVGQFDQEQSLDNLGWDGVYGLLLHGQLRSDLLIKTGIMHRSAHVGDEYAEETGRRRFGYTREELMVGLSWWPQHDVRLYGELGYGHVLSAEAELAPGIVDEIQEPLRIQVGAEWTFHTEVFGHSPWYLAFDGSAFEERDWEPTIAVDAGLLFPAGARTFRVGLHFVDGAPPLGEFFQRDEQSIGVGLWVDL